MKTRPRLETRANGYYYIYFDRLHQKSLKTKDKHEATRLFNQEKDLIRDGKIIALDKSKYIKISEFKVEYLSTRDLYVDPKTKKNDEYAFRKWIELMGDSSLRQIDRNKVDSFKSKCLSLGLAKTYINILLRSLRAGFNIALDKGYIPENFFAKKRGKASILFKIDDAIRRFLFEDEIKKNFEAIDDPDFLLVQKIYLYHGLRRAELVNLLVQDIDLKNDVIYVRKTKSGKDRVIPIHEDVKEDLENYISNLKMDIGPLFPKWRSPDTYSRLFKKNARNAHLSEDVKLKGLRHSCATYMLRSGADIERVKKQLGHQDIKTTEIYAKVDVETLRDAVNRMKFVVKKKAEGS